MPGRHNALNATSAVAVAHELRIPDDKIRSALAKFGGVKRRFTRVGEWNGAQVIDDYGHHPVEIAAVLKAARESTRGQVIAVVQSLVGRIEDRRIITYGQNPQADVRLIALDHANGGSQFGVVFQRGKRRHEIRDLVLPMPGRHNALNATAAVAVAHALGLTDEVIRNALAAFGGVKRRFTRVGTWNGAVIIDDYGHHPVEIAAVLRAARESAKGKVIAVMQPHRYTRLHDLFEQFCTCFNDADTVIVAPVYAAGEAPIPGVDRDALVAGLRAHGHRQAIPLEGPEKLAGLVKELAHSGDYVVCLGAGSITQWAYALPGELQAVS
jgi:UDP-N-acetylmuramate--alanine ligase